jgi:hypothetical protein
MLPRPSSSWTVLLPSDTNRKPITSITTVLLPFETYLLSLSLMYMRIRPIRRLDVTVFTGTCTLTQFANSSLPSAPRVRSPAWAGVRTHAFLPVCYGERLSLNFPFFLLHFGDVVSRL